MLHYIDPTSAFALSREKKNYILKAIGFIWLYTYLLEWFAVRTFKCLI